MIYSVHNLGFESLINTGGSVLFQDGVLFGIANVKFWPISAHFGQFWPIFGYFVANLRTFGVFSASLNNVVVYQNGQI